MGDFSAPTTRLASIRVPTLAIGGAKTDARLKRAVRVVADAVPRAQHRTLAGQTHNVKPEILAPVVAQFFKAKSAGERMPLCGS
jgi:pimeloyl-ACP methyl ester carboxylesterase